ncbi:MAG: sigma-70 family RNA polymerase sigma factor [Nitrospira sp.]|nr:sigma-70 family RNA polymerase sigma factor [Nitrospira sp.]
MASLDTLVNFVRGEQGPLLRFLTWKVRCPSAAADLIQELYLRIVTLANPEHVRNPRNFLYTTAKHLAIDHLRREERVASRSTPLDQAASLPTAIPDAETTVDAKHRLAAVLQAIESMPPKRRAVFVMFKFEHKSYLDIALELNISIKTVENHLTKAMSYCRARFEALDGSTAKE